MCSSYRMTVTASRSVHADGLHSGSKKCTSERSHVPCLRRITHIVYSPLGSSGRSCLSSWVPPASAIRGRRSSLSVARGVLDGFTLACRDRSSASPVIGGAAFGVLTFGFRVGVGVACALLADKSDVPPRMVSPVVPEAAVRRRRLDDALTRGAGELATLVCAGPGWGKTLAVASWLSGRSAVGGAWLTLDADDNDLRTFWSDVLLSLTTAGVLPAESGLSQLASGGEFGAAEVRRGRG